MSACCLCMEDKALSPGEYIRIQSEEGCQLEVANIIIKHFGFEVSESAKLEQVCRDCWKTVSSFHNLYEIVATAQSVIQEKKYILIDNDPLPMTQEVFDESEKGFTCSVQNPVNTENNFFCPEIKIEEHELDQLPKIEVIENTNAIDDQNSPSPVRVSSRLKQLKRVNIEEKIALCDNETNTFYHSDDIDIVENVLNQKRRRGRPRKEKQKDPTEKDSSLEMKKLSVKSEEIIEPILDEANDDDIDYIAEMEDDSDESDSNNSSNSSGSDDCEKSSQHQYAVIPKRVVVRPKKYKKRDKPLVPPVRMSREEIDRRKAQQEEYDRTIEKFFNNKFACSICNLLVHNFTDMVRHHRISHNIDQGYMTCCGRKFKQRKTMAEHALVHWNPEHFKCDTCDKVFHTSRLLEAHEQTHTNSGEPQDKIIFQCDKCPKSFASKSTFDYHNLSKHMPKSEFKFSCPQCNKKLLTERKLNNHLKTAHDPENAIICDKCGKQMRTKHSLKKHQDLIHSDMPRPEPVLMQCQICGTWLKDIRGLKQHMKSIHIESAGEHRCHICSKVSPNARALRRHIYHNHECERKFKCTMCEKAFKRPQELREHTSTHTGEVLYTCPNCPMTFFCSANMYKHRQRLHRAQYEADKNQPRPPNILQAAVGATAAMKVKLMQGHVTPTLAPISNEGEMKYL